MEHRNPPKVLDVIADVVLAYRPKPKTLPARRRKRLAAVMADPPKIAIVAGSEDEAKAAADQRGLSRKTWFYVSSPARLTGAFGLTVIRTGSYRKRKDIAAIRQMLRGCELSSR